MCVCVHTCVCVCVFPYLPKFWDLGRESWSDPNQSSHCLCYTLLTVPAQKQLSASLNPRLSGLRLHGCHRPEATWMLSSLRKSLLGYNYERSISFPSERLTSFARACPFLRGAGHSRAQQLPSPPQSSPHELCAQPEGSCDQG